MLESGFREIHPYVLLVYYLFVGFLVMYFNHPLFLLVTLILLIIINITHDKGQALKRWLPMLFIMGTVMILLNPFLVSRGTNILFYFRGKQVTLEALTYGVTMALSLIIVLILFVSFNLMLNGNKFLYIFSKVLPRTAFLTMLSIRFVPLLKARLDEINAVQRIRGMTVASGTIRARARSGMLIIQILLTWSLEEAIQTADSMKSRGYGTGKKSSYTPYQMEKRDWIWLLAGSILFLICLTGGFLGYGKILIYPELGTLHLYFLDWISLVSMITLVSFPLFVEGREYLRWTFSK